MAKISKYASSNPQELARQIKSNKDLQRLYDRRIGSAQNKVSKIRERFGEKAITSNVTELPSSSEGLSRAKLLQGLAQANRFLKSKPSTIGGYRKGLKKEREQFAESGYGKFSESEMIDVNAMLDELRAKNMGAFLPSDYAVEAANLATEAGMTPDQFSKLAIRAENRKLTKDDFIANMQYFAEHPDLKKHYLKPGRGSSSSDY